MSASSNPPRGAPEDEAASAVLPDSVGPEAWERLEAPKRNRRASRAETADPEATEVGAAPGRAAPAVLRMRSSSPERSRTSPKIRSSFRAKAESAALGGKWTEARRERRAEQPAIRQRYSRWKSECEI